MPVTASTRHAPVSSVPAAAVSSKRLSGGVRGAKFTSSDGPPVCVSSISSLLVEAWREFVKATWNKPEMKVRAGYEPGARRLAETVPEELRTPFLPGCPAAEGGVPPAPRARQRGAILGRGTTALLARGKPLAQAHQQLGDGAAVDQVHHDVVDVAVVAGLVHAHDVGVLQAGQQV